jgi:hypothetical protein
MWTSRRGIEDMTKKVPHPCRIETDTSSEGIRTIRIKGPMTETIRFPDPPPGATTLTIDLGEVDYINSTGVRVWLLWTKALAEPKSPSDQPLRLEIQRAPLAFLILQEFIQNLIPANATVSSFYISYSCLSCADLNHNEVKNTKDGAEALAILNSETPPACKKCKDEDTELELNASLYRGLSRYAP